MLPRIDVGYSAFLGAVTGLLLLALNYFVLNNPVGLATLPTLLVVAVVGLVAYLFPTRKELFGTIAGAVVVLVEAYLSSRTGDPIDVGSVTAALTYLVNILFLWVLPRLQLIVNRRISGTEPEKRITVQPG